MLALQGPMFTCEYPLSFLGTLFDLKFYVGLRASFVGLRESSIGLGNPHLAVVGLRGSSFGLGGPFLAQQGPLSA